MFLTLPFSFPFIFGLRQLVYATAHFVVIHSAPGKLNWVPDSISYTIWRSIFMLRLLLQPMNFHLFKINCSHTANDDTSSTNNHYIQLTNFLQHSNTPCIEHKITSHYTFEPQEIKWTKNTYHAFQIASKLKCQNAMEKCYDGKRIKSGQAAYPVVVCGWIAPPSSHDKQESLQKNWNRPLSSP